MVDFSCIYVKKSIMMLINPWLQVKPSMRFACGLKSWNRISKNNDFFYLKKVAETKIACENLWNMTVFPRTSFALLMVLPTFLYDLNLFQYFSNFEVELLSNEVDSIVVVVAVVSPQFSLRCYVRVEWRPFPRGAFSSPGSAIL